MAGIYLALGMAIIFEVIGTSLLQATQQFTRFWPTLAMALSYMAAFYLLTLALRGMTLGIAYAIWSGVGVVLIAVVGALVYRQKIDLAGMIGLGMIVGGVIVVNLFSNSVSH